MEDGNHIDVIMRTAAASIFGYFLSANFVQHTIKPKRKSQDMAANQPDMSTKKEAKRSDTPQNRIGFALTETSTPPEHGNATVPRVPGFYLGLCGFPDWLSSAKSRKKVGFAMCCNSGAM